MSTPTTRILVTGDVFLDRVVYAGHDHWPQTTFHLGTQEREEPGGAALLQNILVKLLPAADVRLGPDLTTMGGWPRSFAVFDHFQADPDDPKKGKVWRMSKPLGFETPPADATQLGLTEVTGDYEVIVLADAGMTYRRNASHPAWPDAVRDKRALPRWLVLKHHAPLAAGDLWHHLVGQRPDLLAKGLVVLRADELRAEHVRITPRLSWERTAQDLVEEFLNNPVLLPFRKARFVVVRFDTDGALVAHFPPGGKPVFRLVFDPTHLERDWTARRDGSAYGYHTVFVAALIAAVAGAEADGPEAGGLIERGIQAGLAAARTLLEVGHGPTKGKAPAPDPRPEFPFDAIRDEYAKAPAPTDRPYAVVTVPAGQQDWSIADADPSGAARKTPHFGLARRVALGGVKALRGIPYQKFGQLFIVDRQEIESLRALRRLVQDYQKDAKVTKPLSIAVFGAPGSGKSFGVKELTGSILGDKGKILEFNLAQFSSAAELLGLLHQVRDEVLRGLLPVVFWDEFDTDKLKWLPILLAPMQDGKIQDGQISHPIGKCLFVFAGGTAHRFAEFGLAEPPKAAPRDVLDEWAVFKAAKGPDFRSRLGGYLDVLGPNPREATHGRPADPDVSFPLRRALQLRANLGLIKDKTDDPLTIDHGVLTALLQVSRYTNGARSMETIVQQAKLGAGDGPITRSHLPSRHLLAMHTDADEFLGLVERDLGFQLDVDVMAAAVHGQYSDLPADATADQFAALYNALPEHMRDDNRAAARRICEVVSLIGLRVVRADGGHAGLSAAEVKTLLEENLELLAEEEHDRWDVYRRRNGWVLGVREKEKGDPNRFHDRLIAYAGLPDKVKQLDRDAVANYPKVVALAGYCFVMDRPSDPGPPSPADEPEQEEPDRPLADRP